ncbi:MerR family transcriptional regulator [Nocardiopsis tropica]|uniref:MerR family transcriptional regulator n=1 Tax=Nocardiopsis tropica TaxID=109330 RepID=A0ABU7KXN4_9ACTN|nr:MerR family transcriptional regulator [Nocardiopsis umidischolae]MEE2054034.1 MerR family transcriptional regulator [Nocardiopsis umidischolae]
MRIGELAARSGVSVRLLRYYEEQGLLRSTRSAAGQRHYTDDAVERVAFIRRLLAAGVSSRVIAEVLPCAETPGEETFDSAMRRMDLERARITEEIGDLVRRREALDALVAEAHAYRRRLVASGPA